MNTNRIQQLAEQADIGWDDKYQWYVGKPSLKKFAELIVRECIANCDDLNSMKYIASHFGVEIEGLK
jgi:hypothetical protein